MDGYGFDSPDKLFTTSQLAGFPGDEDAALAGRHDLLSRGRSTANNHDGDPQTCV